MNLHEYQAKRLFADYGLPVPAGRTAASAAEARQAAHDVGGGGWVVKAQVHAGGRGKAGGVKRVDSPDQAEIVAGQLLGSRLVTHQSGPEGQPVNQVLVEAVSAIARELYLGAVVDRATRRITFMAASAGGMDIEEVAATHPTKILTVAVDPVAGLQGYQCRKVGFALGLDVAQVNELTRIMLGLYRLFTERDLSLVEINPLVVTKEGRLLALDAKINLDDNALYRQKALADLRDPTQEDERETRAQQHSLNYVALDGNIGCMVNGAGLAMATMDLIQLHGGQPANFLDVGGGTTAERVAEAFKLILSDPKVKAILVNIFGGIVRCDLIAEGVIKAVKEVGVTVPVVVRLEGTNVEQGRAMLRDSGLAITPAQDLTDAAQKAVAATEGK
ncbi:MAG: ADP-forming succinate--CoA ligase subunit beta [Thiohalomonadaceae bacterium]